MMTLISKVEDMAIRMILMTIERLIDVDRSRDMLADTTNATIGRVVTRLV